MLLQVIYLICYCQCWVYTKNMYAITTTAFRCWQNANSHHRSPHCCLDWKTNPPARADLWKHFSHIPCIRCVHISDYLISKNSSHWVEGSSLTNIVGIFTSCRFWNVIFMQFSLVFWWEPPPCLEWPVVLPTKL